MSSELFAAEIETLAPPEDNNDRYPTGTIIYDPYVKRMKIVNSEQKLEDYEFSAIRED